MQALMVALINPLLSFESFLFNLQIRRSLWGTSIWSHFPTMLLEVLRNLQVCGLRRSPLLNKSPYLLHHLMCSFRFIPFATLLFMPNLLTFGAHIGFLFILYCNLN
ncbi:hypothetical protein RND81_02G189500 [Saponaria officinalis]|uniref:Uncharacterized protein n=1 Tax=Saponaria officinalis TaxID=3572 RepID=A0AAW1MUM4_SAPOF